MLKYESYKYIYHVFNLLLYREAELIKHVQQLEEQLQKMIQNRNQDSVEVKHHCFSLQVKSLKWFNLFIALMYYIIFKHISILGKTKRK